MKSWPWIACLKTVRAEYYDFQLFKKTTIGNAPVARLRWQGPGGNKIVHHFQNERIVDPDVNKNEV